MLLCFTPASAGLFCTGRHLGERGFVPVGDTPCLALVKGVIVSPGVGWCWLCVAGLAQAACWPWPPLRFCALFQRQLPVGTAWHPSCLRGQMEQDLDSPGLTDHSCVGCNTWGQSHGCHDYAVFSPVVALCPPAWHALGAWWHSRVCAAGIILH